MPIVKVNIKWFKANIIPGDKKMRPNCVGSRHFVDSPLISTAIVVDKVNKVGQAGQKNYATETGFEPANLRYRKPTRYHCATRPLLLFLLLEGSCYSSLTAL